MGDICRLREANGEGGVPCDGGACAFWRIVEHAVGETHVGCAIQYYELLGDDGVASWLLSVKKRIESAADGA